MESSLISGSQAQELWLQPDMMHHFDMVAERMAKTSLMPSHIFSNQGNALMVVLQAATWKLPPYLVATNTYILHDRLCYSAQLINTVINTMAPLKSRLEYEFFGNWDAILGRVERKTGSNGGNYFVQGWSQQNEQGVGVIVRGTFKNEDSPREVRVLLSQCWPRNSTQWATDPQQQICYAAVQKFARRYCPDAIAGVYSDFDDSAILKTNRDSESLSAQNDIASRIIEQASGDAPAMIEDAEFVDEPQILSGEQLKNLADRLMQDIEKSTNYDTWKVAVDKVLDSGISDESTLKKIRGRARQIQMSRRYKA